MEREEGETCDIVVLIGLVCLLTTCLIGTYVLFSTWQIMNVYSKFIISSSIFATCFCEALNVSKASAKVVAELCVKWSFAYSGCLCKAELCVK